MYNLTIKQIIAFSVFIFILQINLQTLADLSVEVNDDRHYHHDDCITEYDTCYLHGDDLCCHGLTCKHNEKSRNYQFGECRQKCSDVFESCSHNQACCSEYLCKDNVCLPECSNFGHTCDKKLGLTCCKGLTCDPDSHHDPHGPGVCNDCRTKGDLCNGPLGFECCNNYRCSSGDPHVEGKCEADCSKTAQACSSKSKHGPECCLNYYCTPSDVCAPCQITTQSCDGPTRIECCDGLACYGGSKTTLGICADCGKIGADCLPTKFICCPHLKCNASYFCDEPKIHHKRLDEQVDAQFDAQVETQFDDQVIVKPDCIRKFMQCDPNKGYNCCDGSTCLYTQTDNDHYKQGVWTCL